MGSIQRVKEEITAIRAVDNHTHMTGEQSEDLEAQVASIVRYLVERPGTRLQYGGGALLPLRRGEYREVLAALKELYGFTQDSIAETNSEELMSRILESHKRGVAATYKTALDTAGIEIALVNAFGLHPGLDRKRFRWVPFVDHFLYPLNAANSPIREKAAETFEWFEEELADIYRRNGGPPETWEDYLSLIERELKRYRDAGAIAVKVWSAFFRSLFFKKELEPEAKKAFSQYTTNRTIAEIEYTRLQDFLAYYILTTCRDLGLAVHIHVGFGLANDVITLEGSSPLNLETIAGDKELNELKLVLIHGGYPFYREAGNLARMKDNVFIDFSWLPVLIPPKDLSFILREWLAWKLDDRLLFGTDAGNTPWATDDLVCVYTTKRARNALNFALSDMIEAATLSEDEAITVARRVLRDNALALYNL